MSVERGLVIWTLSLCILCLGSLHAALAHDDDRVATEQGAATPETSEVSVTVPADDWGLRAENVVIARAVEARNPVGVGTVFAGDAGQLFCHSLILGAEGQTTVHHVWYWNERKMADVPLTIRSPRFRTHSSKKILPHWTGPWRVEVVSSDGELLEKAAFVVQSPETQAR